MTTATIDLIEIHKDSYAPLFHTIAGSRLVGMHTEDSDYDYLGVTVEPPEYVIGMRKFEQFEWKRPELQAEGVTYSLKKFVSLLVKGNPTILSAAFSPYSYDTLGLTDPLFQSMFISKRAGGHFIGYMQDQIRRLHTSKGMHVTRGELIEKYGYDTKYAAHVIRLGFQGIEYLSRGTITLPMSSTHVEVLSAVRNGGMTYEKFMRLAERTMEALKSVDAFSSLPEHPQYDKLNQWLVKAYLNAWSGNE